MPGLGAVSPWRMLWAKTATHHGRLIFLANGPQWFKNLSDVGQYVGLVLNRVSQISINALRICVSARILFIFWCQ